MDERLEELFPFYALGALTDEERAAVEAYAASDPAARARLDDVCASASALPFAAAPVQPPAGARLALMARITADARARRPAAPPAPAPSFWQLIAAWLRQPATALAFASLALAIAAGAWAMRLNAEVAQLRAETEALRRDLQAQSAVVAQVSAPGAQAIPILGTDRRPEAYGQLIVDPARQTAVLVVSGLSPLDAGRTYQFWLIRGDTLVSAGVFQVDEAGRAVFSLPDNVPPGAFDAMGVSVEPAGGSAQPTGDIVMLGRFS